MSTEQAFYAMTALERMKGGKTALYDMSDLLLPYDVNLDGKVNIIDVTETQRYIAELCEETRKKEEVQLGVSPRGMLALLRLSQAYAAIMGRDFVIPDDVKAMAVPVMAHRVILRGLYGKTGEGEKLIREILNEVPAPTEEIA